MSESVGSELTAKPAESPSAAARWEAGNAATDEVRFFQGPQRRGFELSKAFAIFCEMMHGFRTFHFLAPCVTVFGSARFGEGARALCTRQGSRSTARPRWFHGDDWRRSRPHGSSQSRGQGRSGLLGWLQY